MKLGSHFCNYNPQLELSNLTYFMIIYDYILGNYTENLQINVHIYVSTYIRKNNTMLKTCLNLEYK